jgi:hypothetical protein
MAIEHMTRARDLYNAIAAPDEADAAGKLEALRTRARRT